MLQLTLFIIIDFTIAHNIQWSQEGKFSNCQSKEVIYAQNCGSDDLLQECYLIPEDGLCFSGEEQAGSLFFYGKTSQEGELTLSSGLTSVSVELHPDQELYTASLPKTESLQIQTTLSEAYVGSFEFSGDCLPDCEICSDLVCDQCKEGYMLYNFKCVKMECYFELNNLGEFQKNLFVEMNENQQQVLHIQFNNFIFNECFHYQSFVVDDFLNNNPIYYQNNQQVSLLSENEISIVIPQDKQSYRQKILSNYVNIYYIDFTISFAGKVQYLLQSYIEIIIKKESSSSMSLEYPKQCCEDAVLELEDDEITIIDIELKEGNKKMSIKYNMDNEKNLEVDFEKCQIEVIETEEEVELDIINQQQNGNIFEMNLEDGEETLKIEDNMNLQIRIYANLKIGDNKQNSNIKMQYKLKLQKKYKYQNVQSENDKEEVKYIFIIIGIASFLIILGMGVICLKYIKKKLEASRIYNIPPKKEEQEQEQQTNQQLNVEESNLQEPNGNKSQILG